MLTARPTEDLAVAASQGDSDALRELFEKYHPKLLREMEVKTQRNTALAEDIAAETWEQVAKSIRGFTPARGGFEAWLFTIARRRLAAYYRGLWVRNEHLTGDMLLIERADPGSDPANAVLRKLAAHRLAAEARGLSKRQREVVHYRFACSFTLAETANLMGLTTNAVKQLQFRAVATLRARLGVTDAGVMAEQPILARHQPRRDTIAFSGPQTEESHRESV